MRASSPLSSTLPDSWNAVPLKSAATFEVSNVDKHSHGDEVPVRLCNYTDVYKNERITPDMKLMRATATVDEIEKFHLEVGDVVITKDSETWNDIAVPAIVSETADDLVCGYHLAFIRSNPNFLSGRYLFRAIQSRPVALQLELASTGVTRCGLPKGAIGSANIPLPPIASQLKIADYLDREAGRIDELVEAKESMLQLLEKKRAALISRAVTCGLDPHAPTKPSGLDWLGDIPEHWACQRCASVFTEKDERGEPDLPLLNVSLNTGVTLRVFSEDKIESVAADLATMKIARKGYLVFNKMRFWQGAAGIAPADGLVSPDYTVASIDETLLPEYIEKLFRISQFSSEVKRYSYGMVDDRLRLYWDAFKNIYVPIPPLKEQQGILDFLNAEESRITLLSTELLESVKLLKERRSALITAAVTGKIPLEEMAV